MINEQHGHKVFEATPKYYDILTYNKLIRSLLLFLLYINNILNISKDCKTVLFANDSSLFITGKDPINVIYKANTELGIFYKWCVSNRLTVNQNKTYYALLTNKTINHFLHYLFIST